MKTLTFTRLGQFSFSYTLKIRAFRCSHETGTTLTVRKFSRRIAVERFERPKSLSIF